MDKEKETKEIKETEKEEIKEPKKTVKIETKSKPAYKNKAKVIKIKENVLLLVNDKGHGINIPKTSEHKNVKVGDIIGF